MTHRSAKQQAQINNRDDGGKWQQKSHSDVDDTAGVLGVEAAGAEVPGYTSRGAQALQRLGASKPGIAAVEAAEHEPAEASSEDLGNMRSGLAGTFKQDVAMSYNDGAFSEDGEMPEQEMDHQELELSEDSSARLDDLTGDFMSNNYADLKAFAAATDQDMHDLGADTYLSGSGGGVGFRDRINPLHTEDRQVAERLDEAASETFRTAFENSEIGDDGKLHIPG